MLPHGTPELGDLANLCASENPRTVNGWSIDTWVMADDAIQAAIANDATAAAFESFVHAGRMQAIMFSSLAGRGATNQDVIKGLDALPENAFDDKRRLLDAGWLARPSPFLV